MTTRQTDRSVSRRTALAGLGAGGLGAALALAGRPAAAQGTDLAGHPLAGAWLAMANPPQPEAPPVAVPSFFNADGTVDWDRTGIAPPPFRAGDGGRRPTGGRGRRSGGR